MHGPKQGERDVFFSVFGRAGFSVFRGVEKVRIAFFVLECFVRPPISRRSRGVISGGTKEYFAFFSVRLRTISDSEVVRSIRIAMSFGENTLFSGRNSSGATCLGRHLSGRFWAVECGLADFSFVLQFLIRKRFMFV